METEQKSKKEVETENTPLGLIELRVDSGGHQNKVYFHILICQRQSDGKGLLTVQRQEPLEDSPSQEFTGELSKRAMKKLWKYMDELDVWSLPCTDYNQTLCDDCYHLGVSIEVSRKCRGQYLHQIPTDPFVLVSSVMPSTTEYNRFLKLLKVISELSTEHSKIAIPNHTYLRWVSRTKEAGLSVFNE